ncbi:MAG TPA: DDE-type integrase/transposase/recombinase [Thermoanaerobaculia bacterium]
MEETLREQIALFRYGVIAELVGRPPAPREKEKLLCTLAEREWDIPGSSRRRIGHTTVRDWIVLYQTHGFEGLKPGLRADAGRSRAIPEEVQELLLKLRAERPGASIDSLIRAVQLSGRFAPTLRLSRSSVHRFLAAQAAPAQGAATGEPDAAAFTYPHVNDLWTSDLMYGPRLLVPGRRDGGKTYLYAFLDDASRMVPFAAFYLVENAACFQDALKQALLRRGLPRRLYCDNGATFRTHHLQVICATLNISLVHSRPHKPRGRGKIERFFRHVRTAFMPHLTQEILSDLASLNRVFWAWLEAEYHQTPHGGLEGQTPLDRFLDDQALVRPAPEQLELWLRMSVARRVGKDRVVHLDGRLYEAPDGYAGETVEVLYDPYDPGRPVHFRRKGETVERPLRRLDLLTNATLRRVARDSEPAAEAPTTGISYLELIAGKFYGGDNE